MKTETMIGYALALVSGALAFGDPVAGVCAILGVLAGAFFVNPDWYKGDRS